MIDRLLTHLGKIPAGLMLIPMLLGALVNTFCPAALEIGSFTTAVFSGSAAATFMGLQLLCLGSRLQVKTLVRAFVNGGILLGARVLTGVLLVALYRFVFQGDVLFGVCIITAICASTNTNGSIYISLCNLQDRPDAVVASPIITLNNGPMLPLLLLGVAGYVSVDVVSIFAMLFPILLGVLLGNVSKKAAQFLDSGVLLLMPFIGFTLGAGIDLKAAVSAGATGVVLALVAMVLACAVAMLADRFLCKGNGGVGMASCATGANAVAVPAALALTDPTWAPYVADATAQLATCAVVSAMAIPVLTMWWHKKHLKS